MQHYKLISEASKISKPNRIFGAFLNNQTITFIFSRSNYGKSILAFIIASYAVTGTSINNHPSVKNYSPPTTVLLIDLETPEKSFQRRYETIRNSMHHEFKKNFKIFKIKVNQLLNYKNLLL